MNVAYILSVKFKAYLSTESQNQLNSLMEYREYPENYLLIDQNKICTDLYIIEQGVIRQFYYKDGRDITEHFSAEEDLAFCIESLFAKRPTYLLMETIEPCIVHRLNYQKFTMLCDENREINNLYRQIIEDDMMLTQRKADSWRFETARERYERFCKEYPTINNRVSIAHIASFLLMNPETLSRVRAGVL